MIPSTSAHQFDYKKFIYYHPSTKGDTGRAVYIDPQLIVRFAEIIDSLGAAGVNAALSITDLKSTAAGITADSNKNSAFQHRQTIKNIVVTYTVLQNGGRGAGVYITDLQYGFSKDRGRPGLHKVEADPQSRLKWKATPDDSLSMPYSIGVLGALPPSEDGTSDANETASSFAVGPLLTEARNLSKGFSLFYTPTHVIDNMGVWLTSDQKVASSSISCPASFARLLANTENKSSGAASGERHKWYIVGQGAKVFQQALKEYKKLSKHPLNRSHQFYFVDPQVPLGLLQQDLRDNGFDPGRDKSIINGSMSLASQAHQLADPAQMFYNMYKPAQRFMAVKGSVEAAQKVLNTRNSSTVFFSDIVKNLSAALKGRW